MNDFFKIVKQFIVKHGLEPTGAWKYFKSFFKFMMEKCFILKENIVNMKLE
jgi:hypothetical protein